MILVAIWVVLFLAVPSVAPPLARWLNPTRSAQLVENDRAEAAEEVWDRLVTRPMKIYDKEHGFPERWWEKFDWSSLPERKRARQRRLYEFQLETAAYVEQFRLYDKFGDQLAAELEAQTGLSRWLARVSPYGCFATAAMELVGEGPMEQRQFRRQVRDYHRVLTMYGCDEFLYYTKYRVENDEKRPKPWPDGRQKPVPIFAYTPPAGGDYLRAILIDAGVLAGLVALFGLLAYMSFLRYDVR
jgi:hypothetical protein